MRNIPMVGVVGYILSLSCVSCAGKMATKITAESNVETQSSISNAAAVNSKGLNWGGSGVSLTASENGADVRINCAVGKIEQPIVPDVKGNFNVSGTYQPWSNVGSGGSMTDGPLPVHYFGQINGTKMTLRVSFDCLMGDSPASGHNCGVNIMPSAQNPPLELEMDVPAKIEACM